MAKLNTKAPSPTTHGGSKAPKISPIESLRRSVMSCMLWEKEFYEEGEDIATRIEKFVSKVSAEEASAIAIEARKEMNLRHAPLFVCAAMAKHHSGNIVGKTIEQVISRADELTEYLAIVQEINGKKDLKKCLSSQSKKGVAKAFNKFDEYALAKYNRDGDIKLRDALFLSHAKPKDKAQADLWKRLIEGKLTTPDTWEVGLSSGADKGETFERLLREGKLGYMALLRNLRNMVDSGVDHKLIQDALEARKGASKVLPFRYIAAARHAPSLAKSIDKALQASVAEMPKLPGKTIVLVDVSGSMSYAKVSARSELTRMDAAAALACVVPSEDLRVFSFSNINVEVSNIGGLGGIESVIRSQPHGCTDLAGAVKYVNRLKHDRLIVITDEQSTSWRPVPTPKAGKAYMINVASYANGVGYRNGWTHLDGFSESVLKYISAIEGV